MIDQEKELASRITGPKIEIPQSKGQLSVADTETIPEKILENATVAVSRCADFVRQHKTISIAAAVTALHVVISVILTTGFPYFFTKSTEVGWPISYFAWTTFVPQTGSGTCGGASANYTGSCIYYISPSGTDDATNCKGYVPPITDSPATQCKTINFIIGNFGVGRNRAYDFILYQGGVTHDPHCPSCFSETPNVFTKGISSSQPLVISTYGTGRPIVDFSGSPADAGWFQTSTDANYLAVLGLKITNSGRDRSSVNFNITDLTNQAGSPGNFETSGYYLIENTEISFVNGLIAQNSGNPPPQAAQFIFRGNSMHDIFASSNDGTAPSTQRNGKNQNCILTDYIDAGSVIQDSFFRNCGHSAPLTTGGSVTISKANPAVVTWSAGLPPSGQPPDGSVVEFQGGSLPSPVADGTNKNCSTVTCYFTCNSNFTTHTANLSTAKACVTLIDTSAAASAGSGTALWVDPGSDVFTHSAYYGLGWDACLSNCDTSRWPVSQPVNVSNIIAAQPANSALQVRVGGVWFNNLVVQAPAADACCAFPSTITYNVTLEGNGVQFVGQPSPQQFGWYLSNYTCATQSGGQTACPAVFANNGLPSPGISGTVFTNNIVAHRDPTGSANGDPVNLGAAGNSATSGNGIPIPATTHVTVQNNVLCDWTSASGQAIVNNGISNITSPNQTDTTSGTNSCPSATGQSVANANRTLGQFYDSVVGGSSHTTNDYLDAATLVYLRDTWNPALQAGAANNFIRAGMGMSNPPSGTVVPTTAFNAAYGKVISFPRRIPQP